MRKSSWRGIGRQVGLCALGWLVAASGAVVAQEAEVASSSVTLSSRPGGRAELTIELADGAEHRITFDGGVIRVDDQQIGAYGEGGAFIGSWRGLLREQLELDHTGLRHRLLDWRAGELTGAEADAADALYSRLGRLLGAPEPAAPAAEETATVTGPGGNQLAIAPGGIGFEELARELERLQGSLASLSDAARDAGSRVALIVHDDYAISSGEAIEGNLALLDGTLEIGGTVAGDVLVLNGDLVLADGARIEGDVLQVGGSVDTQGGVIVGEILSDVAVSPSRSSGRVTAVAPEARVRAPVVERIRVRPDRGPFRRVTRNLGHAAEEFTGTLSAFLALGVLGLLTVYFGRRRLEMVADTVRHEFARSFAMGLAGEVLFFPALLIMTVLVITIPVIPFFVIGTGLAMLCGYLAVAHGAGEMFAKRRYRYEWLERLRRSNSYYYVLSGLVLLLIPFALAAALWVFGGLLGFLRGMVVFVACVATWILCTSGFGAVLLTRAGSRSVVVDWGTPESDVEPEGEVSDA
jgi:hypothetical protein